MALAARKEVRREARSAASVRREEQRLRLVTDNTRRQSAGNRVQEEHSARNLFVTITVFTLIFVMLGFGPVIVNAEATRASQASKVIKNDINRAMAELDGLELERSMLRSSSRISQIAVEELDMVPLGEDFMTIEIGTATELAHARHQNKIDAGIIAEEPVEQKTGVFSELAANLGGALKDESTRNMIDSIAELTLGEASALLVGDISLASWR